MTHGSDAAETFQECNSKICHLLLLNHENNSEKVLFC